MGPVAAFKGLFQHAFSYINLDMLFRPYSEALLTSSSWLHITTLS